MIVVFTLSGVLGVVQGQESAIGDPDSESCGSLKRERSLGSESDRESKWSRVRFRQIRCTGSTAGDRTLAVLVQF